MVPVAVITTPNSSAAPDSVPRRIFETFPQIEIEVASFVPLGERAVPYFWVWGDSLAGFEQTIDGYRAVASVSRLEVVDGGALYSIEWDIDSPMIHCIQEVEALLVKAHGTAERWKLTVWFESSTDPTDLLRCCNARGVPIEVDQLHSIARETDGEESAVTPRQKEALVAAYEQGYFERPREVTQAQLADRLGISAAAVGDRLRRGTANIVEHRLI